MRAMTSSELNFQIMRKASSQIFDKIMWSKFHQNRLNGVQIKGCGCSPENGMWLPTGGQIGNGHIRIPSLAHGIQRKKEREKNMTKYRNSIRRSLSTPLSL